MLLLTWIRNDDAFHGRLLLFYLAQEPVLRLPMNAIGINALRATTSEHGVHLLLRRFSHFSVDLHVLTWAQAVDLVITILVHISILLLIILYYSLLLAKSTRTVLHRRLHDVFAKADDLRQILILLDAEGLVCRQRECLLILADFRLHVREADRNVLPITQIVPVFDGPRKWRLNISGVVRHQGIVALAFEGDSVVCQVESALGLVGFEDVGDTLSNRMLVVV